MASCYEWSNRVHFVVRHMYDIDNNGYLDAHDFECLALRQTVLEGKGEFLKERHERNKDIMLGLWNEIADLADFNKDGQVTVEEFKKAVQNLCVGRSFDQFPQPLKHAINCQFATTDANGDGLISLDEFRVECVTRQAFRDLGEIDKCYQKVLNDDDRRRGGITNARYQELFAEFLGCPDSSVQGNFLFGPLPLFEN
ncbi:sarcoplasmic calcium-binding protein 1-like [Ornithodoros turicata]